MPDETEVERDEELVRKGKLFEKLEQLPEGSEITFSASSQVHGQTDVPDQGEGRGPFATDLPAWSLARGRTGTAHSRELTPRMAARRKVGKGKATKRSTRKKSPGRPPVAPRKSRKPIDTEPEYTIIEQTSAVKSPPSGQDSTPDAVKASEILDKLDPDLELLTTRRRRFVEEFMICGNQTKAAELAGFSPNRAEVEGCELMKDPIVAGIIARREANIFARLGLTQERILTERAAIALADLGEVFTERADGTPAMRPLSDWPAMTRKAIKTIKVKRHDARIGRDGVIYEEAYDILELSLWDKPAQLDKMELRLEADRKRGDTAESMTEKQRIRKISEILSRGLAAKKQLEEKKSGRKKAS